MREMSMMLVSGAMSSGLRLRLFGLMLLLRSKSESPNKQPTIEKRGTKEMQQNTLREPPSRKAAREVLPAILPASRVGSDQTILNTSNYLQKSCHCI
jgi:hypothetical protein